MFLQNNVFGSGMPPGLATAIGDAVDSLVATGTTQTDAYELRNAVNRFTTVASGAGARLFQRAQPGDEILVYNNGANALLVYPDVGASIDAGSTNGSISIPAGVQARFVRHRTTVWSSSSESADGISFAPAGTGAITRTVQDALRAMVRSGDYDTAGHFNTATAALTETVGAYKFRVGGGSIALVGPGGNNAVVSRADITLNSVVDHVCYFGYNIADDLSVIPDAADMSVGMGFEASFNDGLGNLISEFHMDFAGPGASYVRPIYIQYYRTGAMTNKIFDVAFKTENTMSLQSPAGNINLTTTGVAITGAGPHSIGGAQNTACQLIQTGTFAGVGSCYGLYANSTLTAPVNGQCAQINIDTTINKAGSGTHANFDGIVINPPAIGAGAATLTNATSLRIVNAPSIGTNKRAFWVAAGTAQFDGKFTLPQGTNSQPSWAIATDEDTGMFQNGAGDLSIAIDSSRTHAFASGILYILSNTATIQLGASQDVVLARDAANVLALKNGANAQEARVYGTTTGPKYLSLKHDGTDGIVDTASSSGKLKLAPTNASDIQWGKALVALGGGAAPTVGTIGGSGPATAAQNSWMRVLDSTGAAFFVPAWK